jgi:hypothetical protein
LYPSTIAWIPYDDLREFVNTTIEPTKMNRLPRLFKVEIGNWVKTGVVAGSNLPLQNENIRLRVMGLELLDRSKSYFLEST